MSSVTATPVASMATVPPAHDRPMHTHRTFDVTVRRDVRKTRLRWPRPAEVKDDRAPGCNREYTDLRSLTWADANDTLGLEDSLIARVERADDPLAEYEAIGE